MARRKRNLIRKIWIQASRESPKELPITRREMMYHAKVARRRGHSSKRYDSDIGQQGNDNNGKASLLGSMEIACGEERHFRVQLGIWQWNVQIAQVVIPQSRVKNVLTELLSGLSGGH
jgi:hypothetical protein